MLVASIASVPAASGVAAVSASVVSAARITVDDPVLRPAAATSAPDLAAAGTDGPAVGGPTGGTSSDPWLFIPFTVDGGVTDLTVADLHAAPTATATPRRAVTTSARDSSKAGGGRPVPGFAPLLWPVPGGYLSQGFGCTGVIWEPPYGSCPHYHNGLDIAAHEGTPIRAAAGGTVVFAGWQSNGGGYQVWVSDGGNMYTGYHHMSSIAVYSGERIARGQRIGAVGMTGNATGPHCHFMVSIGPFWAGGRPVDPRRYL